MIRNFVDETRTGARRFEMAGRAVAVSLAWSAVPALSACAPDPDAPPADSSGSSGEALRVMDCQSAAQSCLSGAQSPSGLTGCDTQLRTCLFAAVPDAGALPSPWSFDGGPSQPVPGPGISAPSLPDGGFTPPLLPDAGITPLSFPDGGFLPLPFPDSGVPGPVNRDGGAASAGCEDDLRRCLGSATSPMTCADQALACLAGPTQCDAGLCLHL